MRPYTEVAESARVSRSAHAKINWIFSQADGVQCNQIGYSPCSTPCPDHLSGSLAPSSNAFNSIWRLSDCHRRHRRRQRLTRDHLMYIFFSRPTPTPSLHTPQHDRILSKANVIELFSSYPIYTQIYRHHRYITVFSAIPAS